jgi:hypothetical protein
MTIWLELGSLGLEAIDQVEDVEDSWTKSVSDIKATPAVRAVPCILADHGWEGCPFLMHRNRLISAYFLISAAGWLGA